MDFTNVKANLEKNGFAVSVFPDGASAAAYLDKAMDGVTVGMGGSVTLQQLGLFERLSSHNTVFWHWTAEDKAAAYLGAQTADCYLSSVNGLAETGEIINIDGSGNRVSAIQYGHKKVYLVVGSNKLAANFDAALYRARNIAAPLNAQRLHCNTPCAEKGDRCYDCQGPGRICCGLSVLWKKPKGCEYEVVLIDETLGY